MTLGLSTVDWQGIQARCEQARQASPTCLLVTGVLRGCKVLHCHRLVDVYQKVGCACRNPIHQRAQQDGAMGLSSRGHRSIAKLRCQGLIQGCEQRWHPRSVVEGDGVAKVRKALLIRVALDSELVPRPRQRNLHSDEEVRVWQALRLCSSGNYICFSAKANHKELSFHGCNCPADCHYQVHPIHNDVHVRMGHWLNQPLPRKMFAGAGSPQTAWWFFHRKAAARPKVRVAGQLLQPPRLLNHLLVHIFLPERRHLVEEVQLRHWTCQARDFRFNADAGLQQHIGPEDDAKRLPMRCTVNCHALHWHLQKSFHSTRQAIGKVDSDLPQPH
mmetsp:Transcript_37239/g.88968  ORF Transcript_37239/g.88968 Transcript_37239/m.88968 type:complete len:330 (-) Transcript_37239:2081-3070(-)